MSYSASKIDNHMGAVREPPLQTRTLSNRLHTLLIVFLAYTLIACVVLWPLLSQFNTAVPGGKDTDYYQFLWNYWWIGHAFANGQSPLWTDYTLYPHISNLSIHTLAPIWYPIYAVTQPLLGTIAAGNLMVLLGFSVTGTAMFAWLRRRLEGAILINRVVGMGLPFLGGLAYAFSPYMMTHASYTQLNLTPLWWFPVIGLLWERMACCTCDITTRPPRSSRNCRTIDACYRRHIRSL